MKPKKEGFQLDMRVFQGSDKKKYLVFHSSDGSFHVFSEVDAKKSAIQCGATEKIGANTRQMWREVWRNSRNEI